MQPAMKLGTQPSLVCIQTQHLGTAALLEGGVEAWLRRLLLLGTALPGLALVRSGAKGEGILPRPAGTPEAPCSQTWKCLPGRCPIALPR